MEFKQNPIKFQDHYPPPPTFMGIIYSTLAELKQNPVNLREACPYKLRGVNEWKGCYNMVH